MERKGATAPLVPTIMVADDDPQVRQLFRVILETAGYAVRDARSGKSALEAIREKPCELLVLDLSMPDVDGFEVLKIVRSEFPGLKILVVSGFLQGQLLKAAALLGAAGTLEKPVDANAFLTAVRGLVKLPAQ